MQCIYLIACQFLTLYGCVGQIRFPSLKLFPNIHFTRKFTAFINLMMLPSFLSMRVTFKWKSLRKNKQNIIPIYWEHITFIKRYLIKSKLVFNCIITVWKGNFEIFLTHKSARFLHSHSLYIGNSKKTLQKSPHNGIQSKIPTASRRWGPSTDWFQFRQTIKRYDICFALSWIFLYDICIYFILITTGWSLTLIL